MGDERRLLWSGRRCSARASRNNNASFRDVVAQERQDFPRSIPVKQIIGVRALEIGVLGVERERIR